MTSRKMHTIVLRSVLILNGLGVLVGSVVYVLDLTTHRYRWCVVQLAAIIANVAMFAMNNKNLKSLSKEPVMTSKAQDEIIDANVKAVLNGPDSDLVRVMASTAIAYGDYPILSALLREASTRLARNSR